MSNLVDFAMTKRSKLEPILRRGTAALLALLLALEPCLADVGSSSFWTERRRASTPGPRPNAPTQLASAGLLPSDPGRAFQGLPRPQSATLSPSIANEISKFSAPDLRRRLGDIVRQLPAQSGTVRDVITPRAAGDRVIIHIQDVHLN